MRSKNVKIWLQTTVLIALTCLLPGFAAAQNPQTEITLYTTREPGMIRPLLDAFTSASNIRVNALHVSAGLAQRVQSEGALSPADVLMTVDIGDLINLVELGLSQSIQSDYLNESIPANLRDPDGHWYTLSLRARVLYAYKDLDLESFHYEDLADADWRDKVCIRSGQHPYNISLIAAHIAHHGEAATETWLRGIRANLARAATGGDRDVARDIAAGICDIGLANSYYIGLMRSGAGGPAQVEWVDAIKAILPTFKGENGGTQVNVSGAVVARHAPNPEGAIQFLEFLLTDAAQDLYAQANYEHPVKPGVPVHPLIAELGDLTIDSLSLTDIARNRQLASALVDRAGFDQ